MVEAFLVGGARTPVGRYGGSLSSVRPDDLAALTVRAAVERASIDPAVVDEVILGNANGAGEENRNVARMAWLLDGYPDSVPGITVNRLCASGLSAIIMASHMVKAGAADIVVAGGVESMSRAPWVMEKPDKAFAKPGAVFDTSIGWRFINPAFLSGERSHDGKAAFSMPETAEEVARVYGTSRDDCDAFAARSHKRALAAISAGRFADEIVPVTISGRKCATTLVDTDEGPRPGTTLEVLAGLRPVVKGGSVVTAGNASSLNDGASAIIVASEAAIERYGLTPRARILEGSSAGVAPEVMGIGPVPATRKVLDRAGLWVGDLGAVELNEAFASQSLAVMRELKLDEDIVNADGGAIALGHPLGSSGSRLVITLLGRMEREARPQARPGDDVRRRRPGHGPAAGARLVAATALDPAGFSTLLVDQREDRVVVVLNRPEVRNAIDQQMVDELHTVCAHLEQHPKVLILAGADGVFASGADIAQLRERRRDDALQGINSSLFDRIAKLPMPVIAALDGFALAVAPSWPTPPTSGSARRPSGSATPKPASASWPPLVPAGGSANSLVSRWPRKCFSPGRAARRTSPGRPSHHRTR